MNMQAGSKVGALEMLAIIIIIMESTSTTGTYIECSSIRDMIIVSNNSIFIYKAPYT